MLTHVLVFINAKILGVTGYHIVLKDYYIASCGRISKWLYKWCVCVRDKVFSFLFKFLLDITEAVQPNIRSVLSFLGSAFELIICVLGDESNFLYVYHCDLTRNFQLSKNHFPCAATRYIFVLSYELLQNDY